MTQIKMTKRQAKLLKFIKEYVKKNGYSPSYDEMREPMGLASKFMVHNFISSLEKHGKIKRVKYSARSVEPL